MPNTIRKQYIVDSTKRNLTKVVLISDGTQETNTVLIDASSLAYALNAAGKIMSSNVNPKSTYRLGIKRIYGVVKSASGLIKLQWHSNGSNSEIVAFGDSGINIDFESAGEPGVIQNNEANTSGDILISTIGLASNDALTLFLDLRKNSEDYDAGQTNDPRAFNQ